MALEPFYIALSVDFRFHPLYDGISLCTDNSIGDAIEAIPEKHLFGLSNNVRIGFAPLSRPPSLNNMLEKITWVACIPSIGILQAINSLPHSGMAIN